ncbi:MAG: histidinol dehydrogenase, partial [Thiohalomonadales bacterium]
MNNTALNILHLDAGDTTFWSDLEQKLAWESVSDDAVNATVKTIVNEVRSRGDLALVEYSNRFDHLSVSGMDELVISAQQTSAALASLPSSQRQALEAAAQRITVYHEKQIQQDWQYQEADGTILGQKITALDRVGLYVPGGKAAYPSSVLMNAIPAKVAGVSDVTMVVPTPHGEINELVLAAAALSGVDQIFSIGGAQAIAAMAYGTQSVPRVDKIVGPGNIYVATAKRMVFGQVGIDMIAGPSEILVVCDGQTDPEWITMDLFSQAEHDEDAQAILV